MTRNIKIKAGIIVAVILVCIYGIIGLPKSKDELVANWKKNIHLGLDLSGGTQLVMQVQLQDAFKAFADNAIERMKDEFKKDNIDFSDINRNDPQTLQDADKIEIDIKGVPVAKSSALPQHGERSVPGMDATALNSTDYRLTMKPTEALKLKQDTMTQTMATIERKINGLGLAESSVQPTGRSDAEAELLVQLPGVDDPAHVKQLLQTQAVLEWDEVKDGPFGIARRRAFQTWRHPPAEHQTGANSTARRAAELVPGFPQPPSFAAPTSGTRMPPRTKRGPLGNQFRSDAGSRQEIRTTTRKPTSEIAPPSWWTARSSARPPSRAVSAILAGSPARPAKKKRPTWR